MIRRKDKDVVSMFRGSKRVEHAYLGTKHVYRCKDFIGEYAEGTDENNWFWTLNATTGTSPSTPLGISGRRFAIDMPEDSRESWYYLFAGTQIKRIEHFPHGYVTKIGNMFRGCTKLEYVGRMYPLENVPKSNIFTIYTFTDCTSLKRIEMLDASYPTPQRYNLGLSSAASTLRYMLLRGFGSNADCRVAYWQLNSLAAWGDGSEENRMSVVNSLLTYSGDRAKNGMSTLAVQLHSDTLARLTEGEIAAIVAKGYTLTA